MGTSGITIGGLYACVGCKQHFAFDAKKMLTGKYGNGIMTTSGKA
jgi:hypothetical protein